MLVLPVCTMGAGSLIATLTIVVLSVVHCYTAYLVVSHLGEAQNVKQLILNHFNQDRFYLQVYNLVIWVSYLGALAVYFPLFC